MYAVSCEARLCCWVPPKVNDVPWCFHPSRPQAQIEAAVASWPQVAIVTTADELSRALQSNVVHVRITAHLQLTTYADPETYFALPDATLKTITVRTDIAMATCASL